MKRNGIRKFLLALAITCVVGALGMLGTSLWALANMGGGNGATASLLATTVFLGCCGRPLFYEPAATPHFVAIGVRALSNAGSAPQPPVHEETGQ